MHHSDQPDGLDYHEHDRPVASGLSVHGIAPTLITGKFQYFPGFSNIPAQTVYSREFGHSVPENQYLQKNPPAFIVHDGQPPVVQNQDIGFCLLRCLRGVKTIPRGMAGSTNIRSRR